MNTTKTAQVIMGTCPTCGASVPVVNFTPRTKQLPDMGYLGRHHRTGTRAGTKCRGSFGDWIERRRH